MGQRKELAALIAAMPSAKAKVRPKAITASSELPSRPGVEEFGEVVPPSTEVEQDLELYEFQRKAKPRDIPGPDPRKPWVPKGAIEAEPLSGLGVAAQPEAVQERIKLNNALANAKRGKRLTQAEKKLLGKWELKRIMARVKPCR